MATNFANLTSPQQLSIFDSVLGSTTSATQGAGALGFAPGLSYAAGTVGAELEAWPSLFSYGAVGDGVTDDTAAIQAAINDAKMVRIPRAIFRITAPLIPVIGSKLIGAGNWSGVASTDYNTGTSRIFYDGPAGKDICVYRASDQPVGTPAVTNMQNIGLSNVIIDGGGKAGIGFYGARCLAGNNFDFITCTNTTVYGALVMQSYDGHLRGWKAYKCLNNGLIFGKPAYSGWSSTNVDETTFDGFFGYFCGYDFATTAQNTFSDTGFTTTSLTRVGTTATLTIASGVLPAVGATVTIAGATPAAYNGTFLVSASGAGAFSYVMASDPGASGSGTILWYPFIENSIGLGFYNGRGNCILNAQAANCGGPGIWVSGGFGPTNFVGGYVEGNCRSTGNTSGLNYNIWVDGQAGMNMLQFDGMHMGLTPAIRLAGIAPSRKEAGVIFRRMDLVGTINADWGNYRLIDCDRGTVFSNVAPTWFRGGVNGAALSMGTSGVVTFDASSGSVVIKRMEGVINSVTRSSAGVYVVGFSETYSGANYGLRVTGSDGCVVGGTTYNGTNVTIGNRLATAPSVLTDTQARMTVEIIGDYG